MQYTYHAGDPSIWLTGVPEFLLRIYVRELPKLRARNILDMIEASILATPAQDDEDMRSKQRRIKELQRQANGDEGQQEKPKMTMQQFASAMGAMGFGFEIIEGEVTK